MINTISVYERESAGENEIIWSNEHSDHNKEKNQEKRDWQSCGLNTVRKNLLAILKIKSSKFSSVSES